jgi:hypothetical protein
VTRLQQLDLAVITIEAIGGFERTAVATLASEELPVAVDNPKQFHN